VTAAPPRVCILLSTFGGATFLPAQLASLEAQRDVDWRLLWRDDGSRDATVEILRDFGARTGRATELDLPGRLGPGASFLALLAAAPGGMVAFCDQDDVWLPDKLARAVAALAALPADRPALYCARQRLVDAELREAGLSPLPGRPPGFGNALVQNIATGCTVVLNDAARRLVAAVPMPAGSMHDWWCYLLVTGCGGQVVFDGEPALLYRQHGRNAVGATAALPLRALRALRRGPEAFLGLLARHRAALAPAPLTHEARAALLALAGLSSGNPLRRLASLRRAGVYRQGRAEDLMLRAWVLLARLPRPDNKA
jgi:glycosyltransferase involved in cell wall biosynthesis